MADEIDIIARVKTQGEEAIKKAKKVGEKIASETQKAGKKIKFGEKIKNQLEKLKIGIENLGIGGDRLSKLGDLFKGGGWLAVAAAGVVLLAQSAMKLWDKMTVSAEQAIEKAKALKEYSQQDLNKTFTDEASAGGYFDRLKQLNEQEELSNLHKMEAIAIVNNLTKVYGDLGLTISGVTGKVLGLDEAIEQMAQRSRNKKIEKASKVVESSKEIAQGEAQKALSEMLSTDAYMSNFTENYKTRGQAVKAGLDVKLNEKRKFVKSFNDMGILTYVGQNLTEKEKKQAQLWNNGGLQGKIQYIDEKIKSATQKEEIENLKRLREAIVKLRDAENQLDNIKKTGFKTADEYLKHLQKENQETQKLKDSIKNQAKEYLKAREAKEEAEFYSSLTPISTKVAYKEIKKNEEEKSLLPLEEKRIKIKTKLEFAEQQLELNVKTKDITQIEASYKKVNALTAELAGIEKEVLTKQNAIAEMQAEINRLKKSQADIQFKNLKNDEDKIKKLQEMLALEEKKQKSVATKKVEAEKKSTALKDAELKINVDLSKARKARAEIFETLGNKNFTIELDLQFERDTLKAKLAEQLKAKDFDGFKKTEKELAEVEKKLAEIRKKTKVNIEIGSKNLTPQEKEVLEEIIKLEKEIKRLEGEIKRFEEEKAKNPKKRLEFEKQIQNLEKQGLQSKMKALQIQAQIKELQKRSVDFYKQQKDALDGQLQVQKLLLQGKYEEAEKQKLVNDLKKQGLKVDQQEVDLITKQKQALQGVQLDRSFKQQGLDLLDSLKPKNRQTAYEKRVRQLEEQSGMKLNQQQKDKVRTLVDVEFKMKQMEELKPDFSGLEIKTNEMTSRGGFAGGAVAPDTDRVNMQIRDYQARSYQTLAQIRAILQRGGII